MSFAVRIEGSDVAFACDDGQTLVDAALAAGVELPYSCRKGVCGNCAGRVMAGDVQPLPGAALRNEHCGEGALLLCRATPTSDVRIAPTSWRRVDHFAPRRVAAKVYRVARACSDVSIVYLRLPAGTRVKFRAGQYLQVLLEDGQRRSYSMANPPHENDSLVLHVRHLEGGLFSGRVAALQAGDVLNVEAPLGSFSLHDEDTGPLLFVAGGTGFAPVKAMLDDIVKRAIQRPATLLWGVRRAEHLYAMAAVERWQKLLPGFRFQAVLSDAPAPPGDTITDTITAAITGAITGATAGTATGLVHQAIAALCPSLAGHTLYCCGAPPMVAAVRTTALALGLAPAHFHCDVFVTSA